MDSFAQSFALMLIALAFVLALAWFALRVMRQRSGLPAFSRTGGDDALRFIRALPVGAKERVVIIEYRGTRWMLGVTAGGINTIASWPGEEKEPAETHREPDLPVSKIG